MSSKFFVKFLLSKSGWTWMQVHIVWVYWLPIFQEAQPENGSSAGPSLQGFGQDFVDLRSPSTAMFGESKRVPAKQYVCFKGLREFLRGYRRHVLFYCDHVAALEGSGEGLRWIGNRQVVGCALNQG